jgi:uncharacterized membrane protein
MRPGSGPAGTVLRGLAGLTATGMAVVAVLTVRHWFDVRFPRALADATSCSGASSFSCLDAANAPVSAPWGIPIGVYGLMVSGVLVLAALFPSREFDWFARRFSLLNLVLATALSVYSIVVLRSLCPLCFSYTALSALYVAIRGIGAGAQREQYGASAVVPSPRSAAVGLRYLAVFGAATVLAGWSVSLHREARVAARVGSDADHLAAAFLRLEPVPDPSVVSPYWIIRSSERFEDAAIRMIVYSDFLCSDCRFFSEQLHRLEREFPGRLNVVHQFFPLEARCNDVVAKDKHPGACEVAYIAAYRPDRFRAIHDEIHAAGDAVRDATWRQDLARRYDAEAAGADSATRATVHRLIATGAEYARTSDRYAHGIRSTPTTLINGRMLIGTLPYDHLRAIVLVLLAETGTGQWFLENWED